jgi:hypothetical protein
MLTGSDLLAKVKECGDMSKSDLVRACGYVKNEKLCFTQFYNALLQAKGVDLGNDATEPKGRKLSYRAKVQFNGKLLIGDGYMRQMGMEPGDTFKIDVGRKHITLTAVQA